MIVDAPATGQGIGFLQTPRTFAGIARVGPIHAQAQELDRFITDHDDDRRCDRLPARGDARQRVGVAGGVAHR